MDNHRRALIVLSCLALPLSAAKAGGDPMDILREATAKVLASAERAPDYTCLQTVERHYFRPAAATLPRSCAVIMEARRHPTLAEQLRPMFTDRLRMEVILTHTGEIFAWPGGNHFEDDGIEQMIPYGPIGSGAFAAFLDVIFRTDVKGFRHQGRLSEGGIDLLEYSFAAEQKDSHYRVKGESGDWLTAGYRGWLLLNPATGDLVRLQIETNTPLDAIGSCQTSSTLDFGMVPISGAPFLLPVHATQRFIFTTGAEVENTTDFAACREYRGESKISYEAPPAVAGASGVIVRASHPNVEAGLPFTLELSEPIDLDHAAVGDLFRARLVRTLYDSLQRTVARAGSIVEGRVVRLQSFQNPDQIYLALAPRAVLVGNDRIPMAANRNWAAVRRGGKTSLLLPPQGQVAGVFVFPGKHVVLPRGYRTEWRTAEPKPM